MDTIWHIELLGRLRATQGDRRVTRLRTHKAGALLAYLAYYLDRPHPREVLIELLWPEGELHSGRNNLSRELSSLRRQLEPPGVPTGAVILADRNCVQLNPALCTTDVAALEDALRSAGRAPSRSARAERLTRAAELYQGELLPGYFENWVLHERQRLAALFLQALEQLILYHQEAGDLDTAIAWARRAVAADPLREEGHHDLIRLLAAAGQPEVARRQYQALERLLAQELGVEPAPEIGAFIRDVEQRGRETGGQRDKRARGPDRLAAPASGPRCITGPAPPPTGTVTFLLAEIDEGAALEEFLDVLRPLIPAHSGFEIQAARGMLQGAFARASDALAAAVTVHRHSLSALPDPAALPRIALHTGEVTPEKQARQSPALQHATRLLLAASPGQILVSEKSAVLLRDDLEPGIDMLDLGRYRLREHAPPEQLFQACSPDLPAREFPPPNALPAHEGSVPLPLNRFFGREEEIARLLELLKSCTPEESALSSSRPRLVTLTGPGGSGKTRLALEVARQLRAAFHGAVWFVPLQDLADSRLIPDKLLDVLRLPRTPQVPPLEQAAAFLSRQPSLLLLDNFEHLVTEGALLLQTLLERVPALVCLVTSRQRLNLAGEQEFPVAPLPVPGLTSPPAPPRSGEGRNLPVGPGHAPLPASGRGDEGERLTPDLLMQNASVRLFVDRAQAVRPDFQVTRTNAGAVGQLCVRLEGLPLALELAAARSGVLTPQQMLERLSQRFELLARPQGGAVPRHRSLWAALEWSYQLLPAELQQFFARLSVFQGGWTLEAAGAVAGSEALGETTTLQYLEQLRECSLVEAAEVGGGIAERSEVVMRFRLLETLREYGAEQLGPEERMALADRHASYYLALAERAEPELVRAEQGVWLDRLKRDLDDLRVALAWLEARGELQAALRLVGALWQFWQVQGYLSEGQDRRLLSHSGAAERTAARAKGLNAAGFIARTLGDLGGAQVLQEESLAIWQELGDPRGMAISLDELGRVAFVENDYRGALALFEEALSQSRNGGDRAREAMILCNLGELANRRGDYPLARALLEESIALQRELGNRWGLAVPLFILGKTAFAQGDLGEAQSLWEETLVIDQEQMGRGGDVLRSLGQLAAAQGDYAEARAWYEEYLAQGQKTEKRESVAGGLLGLGDVACLEGDYAAARILYQQALALQREQNYRVGVAASLERLAGVCQAQDQSERAVRLLGLTEALVERGGVPLPAPEQANLDRIVAAARAALGEATFAVAWAQGKAMTWEEAVAEALEERT